MERSAATVSSARALNHISAARSAIEAIMASPAVSAIFRLGFSPFDKPRNPHMAQAAIAMGAAETSEIRKEYAKPKRIRVFLLPVQRTTFISALNITLPLSHFMSSSGDMYFPPAVIEVT